MQRMLFLAHRIPFPPDKGEKIRAWHIFEHLARTHRMHLGCLVDDPADLAHVPYLRDLCADLCCVTIDKRRQKLKALAGLRPGRPLTLDYFAHPQLQRWVDNTLAGGGIERIFVYCSAMAPFVMHPRHAGAAPGGRVLDMVDIDSEKWSEYAARSRPPASLIWAREGRTLLAFERAAARHFDRALFVSPAEAARFAELAPEAAERIGWVENGVDSARFSPAHRFDTPFDGAGPALVFTGTMDYWPNEDAVIWFARDILPALRQRAQRPTFHIVGASPTPAVRALAALPGVFVTGRVPDVRPYVAHAAAAVAPLRIARGIQNKVLEAMAMGRPVVASPQAFEGIRATPGRDLLVADGARAFTDQVAEILDGRHPDMGTAARTAILDLYRWPATLARLDMAFGETPRSDWQGVRPTADLVSPEASA